MLWSYNLITEKSKRAFLSYEKKINYGKKLDGLKISLEDFFQSADSSQNIRPFLFNTTHTLLFNNHQTDQGPHSYQCSDFLCLAGFNHDLMDWKL